MYDSSLHDYRTGHHPQMVSIARTVVNMVGFYMQQELTKANTTDDTLTDQVETCLQIVTNLLNFYKNGDLILKQQLIGLIYPEKAVLKQNRIQTIRPNRAIELICQPSADREDPQKKMAFKIEDHSNVVTLFGYFSNRVYEELKNLFILKKLINNEV